ncbi:divergent PAP2 family protein [Marispirochaeta aestuarii]|uniref:divergent PAP2 family protein n=1 Tax=Marispirochaeta aestuarii TaxID=1963862 RepID=UPI0029C77B7B|nr:divergent PAP2 family protein [Marispirochaeta aestuarii]
MQIPVSLLIALGVQQLCQLIKFVSCSIRGRNLSPRYFFSSGGMPSAHSAFVTALCVAVGVRSGIGSEVFSATLVLAFIVIHDALRVRGALQQVIHIIKKDHPEEGGPAARLPDTIGHDAAEIAAGIILGIILALPLAFFSLRFVPGNSGNPL